MNHLMVYVDGNRRWGRARNLSVEEVYRVAASKTSLVIDFCCTQKIPYLTLYTSSTENIAHRSPFELDVLYRVITECFEGLVADACRQGVRILFRGNLSLIPSWVADSFRRVEVATHDGRELCLTVLFAYGGQDEIVHAARTMMKELSEGSLRFEDVSNNLSVAMFRRYLWTSDIPDPELIIRPAGGIRRLSNGPLFQGAYSEIFFLDECWPDMTHELLAKCCALFEQTPRHHGF